MSWLQSAVRLLIANRSDKVNNCIKEGNQDYLQTHLKWWKHTTVLLYYR
jgi:hypothetical protein